MADVVDALIVTLGLDASQFNTAQKEALVNFKKMRDEAGSTAKEMEARGKQAAQFFSQVKTEALSLMGVLLGGRGLESFVASATTSMAALGREARNIGIGTAELGAFRNMIERNGGSADAAQQSFRGLVDEMERFNVTGQSGIIRYLNTVGANRGDTAMAVYEKFAKYAETHDTQLTNMVGRGLGFDQGTINEAQKGLAQVRKDMAESFKIGVPTDEMSKHMQQLYHDWYALRQAADNVGNTILDKVQPAMSELLTTTKDWIEANPKAAETVGEVGAALLGLGAIRISASVMGLTGLQGAITGLVASTATLAFRLGLLGLAIWTTYEALHITGLNKGEKEALDEYKRENGIPLDPAATTPTVDPFKAWMRHRVGEMPQGPMRRYLADKFGTDDVADVSMNPAKIAFLKTLSGPESGGAYNVKNGGSTFDDFSKFPEGIGKGGSTSASGRYQFISDTWREASNALGLTDFSPASQDKAAWWLAAREYAHRKGRDLEADIKGGGHERDIADALKGRWPSLPGGSQTHQTQDQFDDALHSNLAAANAAPAAVNVPGNGPLGPRAVTSDPSLNISPRDRIPGVNAPSSVDNSSDVSIGTMVIHTQATDPQGIAHSIGNELADNLRLQANRGLQ